jgi:hypothetical protein
MKKMIVVFVLACAFTAASANTRAGIDARTSAFLQPFSTSYMLDTPYIWFTDIDLTDPVGTYCDVFYEMDRLRSVFPGFSFSHIAYAGLNEFEYGVGVPWIYATIYSDLHH